MFCAVSQQNETVAGYAKICLRGFIITHNGEKNITKQQGRVFWERMQFRRMKALYLKYKDFIMEVVHFGMVGVINTLMGWAIMAVLYNLIHMNYWLSSGISYFIGSVFSYHANAKLTFKVENRDKWLPWRFALNIIVCYLVSFSVAQPLVGWLLDVSGLSAGGAFSQALLDNIAMIFGMGIFIVMNFFGQKLFVFRTGRHKKEKI